MKIYKNKKQKGYAILFTVIIVSAISVITAGLSNAAYKQLILSSLAKDSQTAFYQADTASDCVLYLDQVEYSKYIAIPMVVPNAFQQPTWTCGGLVLKIDALNSGVPGGYELKPPDEGANTPCFRVAVTKTANISDPTATDTSISAKGYNICNTSSIRTVEREIQIDY